MAQGQVCYKKFVIGAAAENPGHRNKSAPRLCIRKTTTVQIKLQVGHQQ
jgi:hypothetical protein